jgi:tetratricopeptide (TPR) repeat protein
MRHQLLILIVFFQSTIFGQDLAQKYFKEVSGIESTDNYKFYLAKCDSAIKVDPNDFNSRFSRALIFSFKQKYELEREEYKSIIAIDSTNADIYFNLAASYINESNNLTYIPKLYDYERKKSKRKNHWDCKGDEVECMKMAHVVYPLIKRAALIDTNTTKDYPDLKEMERCLQKFIKTRE